MANGKRRKIFVVLFILMIYVRFPLIIQGQQLTQPLPINLQQNSAGLSFSQSFSSNWAFGEQNFFAARLSTRNHNLYRYGNLLLNSSIILDLGATHTIDSLAMYNIRTIENEAFVEALFTYQIGWRINPYICSSVKTPVTKSYKYWSEGRIPVAGFWDPVISQESIGFTYFLPIDKGSFTTRFGPALRQTRAKYNTLLTDDISTPNVIERYKPESGIESVTEFAISPDSALIYIGRLELFGNFQRPDVWTMNLKNEVRCTIWRFVAVTLDLDLIQNVQQSLHTQFRQSLMMGVVKDF